jgi:hypothetical protein
MGQQPYRRTSSRGLRAATLALLCVLGGLLAPVAATAQGTTTGSKPPAAATTGPAAAPDATDAVTTDAPGAAGGATTPGAGAADPAAGATPGAADPANPTVDPANPTADPAAVDPNAPATTPAPTTTTPAGTETAATGVVVQEPDDDLPGWVWGAVAVGIVAAALVAWLLVLASGRFERLAPVGHALGEAGWRLSNRWAEFVDWLRFGSGR